MLHNLEQVVYLERKITYAWMRCSAYGPAHRRIGTCVDGPSDARLLVAGFSDRSNSVVRRRNGGFPCRIWAPTVRWDKINRWNCLKRNFVGACVGCSQSAMSVPTQNVFSASGDNQKSRPFQRLSPEFEGSEKPVTNCQANRRGGDAQATGDLLRGAKDGQAVR
jgi:hypothetical protein